MVYAVDASTAHPAWRAPPEAKSSSARRWLATRWASAATAARRLCEGHQVISDDLISQHRKRQTTN